MTCENGSGKDAEIKMERTHKNVIDIGSWPRLGQAVAQQGARGQGATGKKRGVANEAARDNLVEIGKRSSFSAERKTATSAIREVAGPSSRRLVAPTLNQGKMASECTNAGAGGELKKQEVLARRALLYLRRNRISTNWHQASLV